jgi:signal transduction histidine kinase/ligand-binding sensor domain-containing protein
MRKYTSVVKAFVLSFGIVLILLSCNIRKTIPLPENRAPEPVTRAFKFGLPKPLEWEDAGAGQKAPQTVSFDRNKLPSKPFGINGFKPLKMPLQPRKVDLKNLPDSAINLDTIAALPIKWETAPLPQPEIIKTGMLKLLPGTTTGILHLTQEDGLPGQTIYASYLDRSGILWLATEKALTAYSGDNLHVYYLTRLLASVGTVISITEDSFGNIWLGTSIGVYIINVKSGTVSHFSSPFFWLRMLCDHTGTLWGITFNDGLYIINKEATTIKKIQWSESNQNDNFALRIMEDRDHNIWLGNKDHVSIIDAGRKKIKKIGKKEGIDISSCATLFEDSRGDIWTGAFRGDNNIISLKDQTITTLKAETGLPGNAMEFAEDGKGQIWTIQNDSITIINKERTASKTIITNAIQFLQGKSGLSKDKNGNLWIGSKNQGFLIIDPNGTMPENYDTKNGLVDNNVWGLAEDKTGNIWMATYKGINIYDPVRKTISLLDKSSGLGGNDFRCLRKLDEDNLAAGSSDGGMSIINLSNNRITNIGKEQGMNGGGFGPVKDNTGKLWIPSFGKFFLYDPENATLKRTAKSNSFSQRTVWEVMKDRNGNLWSASDSGVIVIDPVNNTCRYLLQKDGLCNNSILKIIERKNGEIWLATLSGISIVNTDKNTITNLTSKEGLRPDEIYDLVDYNDNVYAGSVDGMIVISEKGKAGDGTNKWTFTNYSRTAGFPYNDYNQMTGIATKNGQLWWGVTPVLTVITNVPVYDSAAEKVAITGIGIMDIDPGSYSGPDGYFAKNKITYDSMIPVVNFPIGLSLPHDQNSIAFSFNNDNFVKREKIAYRYVLEGADERWSNETDKSFSKTYYSLSPGAYTFKVQSKGRNGIWGTPAAFNFSIRTPWWKTWWAYILYALILAGIIWVSVQYRSRLLKKENRILEEKVNHRTAQLKQTITELKATQDQLIQSEKMASLGELTAGIAHEIQNPLNFVNNFSEVNSELIGEMNQEIDKGNFEEAKAIAKDITENEQKIIFHGKRADAIVKGMLQHSRASTGQKEETNINALADEYLRLAYHGLRAKDKSFNANMKTDYDERIGTVNVVSQEIGRVILNLITNAFHAVMEKKKQVGQGYEPTVTVITKKMEDKIEVRVKDNANGIPQKVLDKIFQPFFTTKPPGQGTGLGLSLSYDIVNAHNGELKVETKEGEGTVFIISLPI